MAVALISWRKKNTKQSWSFRVQNFIFFLFLSIHAPTLPFISSPLPSFLSRLLPLLPPLKKKTLPWQERYPTLKSKEGDTSKRCPPATATPTGKLGGFVVFGLAQRLSELQPSSFHRQGGVCGERVEGMDKAREAPVLLRSHAVVTVLV